MPHQKLISCGLVFVGMGWTFAEVRRFFFHTWDFCSEAVGDYRYGRTISLISGTVFLFIGAALAFHAFGLGPPVLTFTFPYVVAGIEAQRFLTIFGVSLVVWGLLSAASVRFLPPPLFSKGIASALCYVVRGCLLLVFGFIGLSVFQHIGDKRAADGAGLLCASYALFAICTGSLWNRDDYGRIGLSSVTCAERPFPFVASVISFMGIAYIFIVG